ncbi:hypothetical protein ABZ912_04340 [Nonomuraea angiospora]|uniref:hypothetical protein n=1 Tax=Nonomuraea angiospora TaxID=46172 RepID=UPI0033CF8FF6
MNRFMASLPCSTAAFPRSSRSAWYSVSVAYVNGYTVEEQARKAETWPREQRDAAFRAGLELILAGARSLRT